MKYWIYRCRGKSVSKLVILPLGDFQKELLEFRENEKNTAWKAGKLALYLQKWEQVKFSWTFNTG